MQDVFIQAAAASEIAHKFGVNWPLFINSCIAFLIVALALKKFAYAPVLKVLEDRKQRIAEGIENADKIKAELEATQAERRIAFSRRLARSAMRSLRPPRPLPPSWRRKRRRRL